MKHLLYFLLSTFSFTLAQSNHSLSFDGDGDYAVIEDASSYIVNSNASLIGWFKINEFDDLNPLIGFRNYPNDNCSMYAVMGTNGTIETMVNGNQQSFIQASYSSDQWYHIALIFDGETFKTYLDGELAASVNTPSSIFNCSDTDLIFGGMQVGDFEDLNGGVDDVSLWTLALTEDQIQAHMNTPLSGDESGLVGYWNFNDGEGTVLTDLSGNGNHGTITGATWSDDGAPVTQQPSPNHSLSFDGQDDYVQIADSDELDGMDNLTVQLWVKFDTYNDYSTGSEGYNILSKSQSTEGIGYALYTAHDEQRMTFIVRTENGQRGADLPDYEQHISLNQWHLITGVYDGNNVLIYIDGVLKGESSELTGSVISNDYPIKIASNVGSSLVTFFDGLIDEVSIMSTALSVDQIQAYINNPVSGDESGLVGYWNFNDGQGSTLTDLSGNGNHGTINGATWSDDGAPVQLDTIATVTLSEVDAYIFPGYIGDTTLVAVTADLGDIDLYSSEMHFTGFQGVLGFEGIVTEGTPMGDADWNVIVNEQEEVLITGNYGSDAISGDVTLFYLQFSVGDSLAEDSIAIQLAHVELNEEEGEIETFDGSVSVSHLFFGDVTQNDDVSMMDAANVLRYLVGSVDFDKYQMSAADVTMDESISALDASVVAQYGVGLVESLPHSEGTDGQGFLTINEGLEYRPGEILEVPVMLTGGNNLLSFEVDLTYDPNQVTVEGIDWSDQIDHFMIEENNEPGSIRVAGSGTTPDGQEGLFATLRLQVLETTTDQSIDLTINKIRINESAPVEDVMVFITQEVLSTDNATVPNVYALYQNYPNPFNPTTKISYDLPEASVISLSIYDLMGREIRTMINSEQTAGFKNIQWNATDNLGKSVPAGMYIYTIQAGEFRQTRKMVLLK